ncbi:MAG: RNase adapter RapZ, partial [Bacillota bacterium]|nr:RNase adapter RapZ [Bacillota bacterium]
MERQRNLHLLIVTGLSGAGKTLAVQSLEDVGFYCVDNLPPSFIPKFAELCAQSDGKIQRVALVIDVRGGQFFASLFEALEQL